MPHRPTARGSDDVESATDIVLDEGEAVTGIDLEVRTGPYVRGTVLNPDGGPAAGTVVRLEALAPGLPEHSATTDERDPAWGTALLSGRRRPLPAWSTTWTVAPA